MGQSVVGGKRQIDVNVNVNYAGRPESETVLSSRIARGLSYEALVERFTKACHERHEPPARRHEPVHKVRFVTAASLFDGHDASINIMRRILQSTGCEVIHLGHNRAVEEIVDCAIQEDAHGIAISSYQGGHVEFFKYMLDLLRERGAGHIKVFGGGGGVIVPAEIDELQRLRRRAHLLARGRPAARAAGHDQRDRRRLRRRSRAVASRVARRVDGRATDTHARARSPGSSPALESGHACRPSCMRELARRRGEDVRVPTLGITGTGGAGKSSLTDELVRRFRLDQGDRLRIAIISIDPSRRKSGGALLGDRIRMNAIDASEHLHALAGDAGRRQRRSAGRCPTSIAACKVAGFDLVIVETSGIGQGDAAIVPLVDRSLYVMTPEFGAASQLEKIDMLDFADFVAINKFDRKGAQDALRDVRKQYQRNRERFREAARRDAGVRHDGVALQRRRRHRALSGGRRKRSSTRA